MLNSVVYYFVRCCNLWTRLRVSYAALFDPGVSGSIGILPDSTAGLLRFKCVLTLIVVLMMISALKPVYVGQGCHNYHSGFIKKINFTVQYGTYSASQISKNKPTPNSCYF